MLNTTGIEPLLGELSEIQSRTFVINFDIANQGSDCFSESEIIADIQKHRDLILFSIMKRTRQVLAMMRAERRGQVLKLLNESLGDHDKRRSNEHLSLMYLITLAGSPSEEVEAGMKQLRPSFVQQIQSINRTSRETAGSPTTRRPLWPPCSKPGATRSRQTGRWILAAAGTPTCRSSSRNIS